MADQKKDDSQFTEAVALATKIAVETAMKATLGAQVQAPVRPFSHSTGAQCSECGQHAFITEKGLRYACDGAHTKMVVQPAEAEHFPGVCVNGVWYHSRDSRPITVPAANDIQEQLNRWDAQEREYRTGRKINPRNYNPVSRPPKAENVA